MVELAEGFSRFVRSEDAEDNEHLWSLGLATFAARLVSAGLASDPISTRELRDSLVLVDTNVLLAIALDEERRSRSFSALAKALQLIGAELHFLYETKREYEDVTGAWREQVLRSIEKHGVDVVEQSDDNFIQAAVRQGCKSPEDYDRFFRELLNMPNSLGSGVEMSLLDDAAIAEAAAAGEADVNLVTEIQNHWNERRSRPKSRARALHDSALTAAARRLVQDGRRAWVLTFDMTMHDLALRWAGPAGTPLWVSLDVLLQVLAVDQDGTQMEAIEFGPLLSLLITQEVVSQRGQFTLDDIRWLDELLQDVSGLSSEEVRNLAQTIHKERLAGAGRESPELRLTLERIYQHARSGLAQDIVEARRQVAEERGRADAEHAARVRAEQLAGSEIETKLRRRAKRRAVVEGIAWLVVAGVLATIASILWRSLSKDVKGRELVGLALQLGSPVLATLALVWKRVLPNYRNALGLIREQVERELKAQTPPRP